MNLFKNLSIIITIYYLKMEKKIYFKSPYNFVQSKTNSIDRIFFLDNFRSFLIILVVLFHASLAYIVNADVWFIFNPQKSIIFDVYAFLFDRTIMPMLFFISGYFALSSILKRGTASFLKKRFVKLGIPFIIGIFIVNPFSMYIINLYNNKISNNFFNYWFSNYLTNIPFTLHLWFLVSLLIIIILFSITFKFKKSIFKIKSKSNFSSKFLLIFAFLIGLALFIINLFISDLEWAGIGGFIIVQPLRFVLYISYFFFGVFAFRNKFFSKYNTSNKFLFITMVTIILAVLYTLFYYFFHKDFSDFLFLKYINGLLWSFICLCSLMMMIKLFHKRFNFSSKFGQKLSANSYAIYIFHYPFVIYLQYILINWSISPIIKFILVIAVSISITYIICEYLLHRIPIIKKFF